MWLGWGPDIAFFYNDAAPANTGEQHPNALAVPMKILWAEIWDDIERLKPFMDLGQATWDRALCFCLSATAIPERRPITRSRTAL